MSFDLPLSLSPASGGGPLRGSYPIRTGIPFPKGFLKDGDAAGLALVDPSGNSIPRDLAPLARWRDGSWRWAELRFLARGEGPGPWIYRLADDRTPAPAKPLEAVERDGAFEVDTGAARFRFAKDRPWPFLSVATAHGKVAGDGGETPGGRAPGSRLEFTPGGGGEGRFRIAKCAVESAGAAALTLAWTGSLTGPDGGSEGETCELRARVTVHAGAALAKAEFTLWNPRPARHKGGLWDLGDPGSFLFRALSLPLAFAGEGSFRIAPDPESEDLLDCGAAASLRQESSGNDSWRSLAHADRTGRPAPAYKGWRFRSQGAERVGDRANPVLVRLAGKRTAALALENFRETFPNALRVEGEVARLEPFPAPILSEGGLGAADYELQGGEKACFTAWADFAADPERPHLALLAARNPLAAGLPPEWHARSGAWGHLPAAIGGGDPFFEALAKGVVEGPDSFFRRRERFEELGWRNFGEVAADHELLHYKGKREFVSHYNNQYDVALSLLGRHAMTGDPRWHALGRDLARHVIHHDLYHTRGDKPAYNGGYFWHTAHYLHAGTATHRTYSRLAQDGGKVPPGFGGGPANEHNYGAGLLQWHYLSGDPEAREAVLQLARWVRDMQDGNLTVLRFLSRNPTGLSTCTRELAWQGPGRGGAFSINACLDAFSLTGEASWLRQAEDFIATCIHPDDDPAAMDLLNREERWSYVVFLQSLGKYLEAKREAGEAGAGADAGDAGRADQVADGPFRMARASLLRYAAWMLDHEYPYLDKPEQLEFPTSTWAAQELRKVHAFLYAARWAPPGQGKRYRDKADAFLAKAKAYLAAAPDPATVRNLALILGQLPLIRHVEEAGDAWELRLPAPEGPYPPKKVFVPQKIQAKKNLKAIVATFGAAGVARFALWLAKGKRT